MLAACQAGLQAGESELAASKAALAECQTQLVAKESELAACTGSLEACQNSPRLAATGQTKCYDAAGAEIDCASADFPGQDGFYQVGCPSAGRFVDNGMER